MVKTKPVYREYIQSDQWRGKHRHWLEQTGKHCTLLLIPIGLHRKYHPYAIHHLKYDNLGDERLGRDVLPVSEFAHDWIIHGILSEFKRPSQQHHYPNAAQRLAHAWMRLRLWFKRSIIVAFCLCLLFLLSQF